MRVLVTGAKGQFGFAIVKKLAEEGVEHRGLGHDELDITDALATWQYLHAYLPDVVIHCAAYTQVDKAEEEVSLCRAVNVAGTENMAKACQNIGAKMIYFSTDYVFAGQKSSPYEIDDLPSPLNEYGKSKLDGERAVKSILGERYLILRISWVFGKNGNNFVNTMLRLGRERAEVSVVSDQIGSPTYAVDVAALVCRLLVSENCGTYHVTNEGICSWADFAKAIFSYAGLTVAVNEISTAQYPTKAKRPLNSILSKACLDRAGISRLPDWQDALQRYLREVGGK